MYLKPRMGCSAVPLKMVSSDGSSIHSPFTQYHIFLVAAEVVRHCPTCIWAGRLLPSSPPVDRVWRSYANVSKAKRPQEDFHQMAFESCPLCQGTDTRDVGKPRVGSAIRKTEQSHTADSVRVLECRSCHYYYCSPFISFSPEDFEILYDNEYFGQPTEQYANRSRVSVPTRNLQRLESLCTRDVHDFLEIGCGEGYALEAAQNKRWRSVGVGVTPAYAESVSKRLGVQVLIGQFQELALPEESFDIIYVNSVLEHVTDPEGFLRECWRVLRPGGMAFFLVPNEDALINDFRHIIYRLMGRNTASRLDPFRNPYHIQGFSPFSLRLLFERANFNITSLEVTSGTNEIGKFKLGSCKKLAFQLALYPVYWLGERIGRGTSLVTIVTWG